MLYDLHLLVLEYHIAFVISKCNLIYSGKVHYMNIFIKI